MNIDDLEESLGEFLPSTFRIRKDRKDSKEQIIIYTGLTQDDDGELIDLDNENEEEEDDDIDPDFEPLSDDDED